MLQRNIVILATTLFLWGCKSHEGLYAPDCIAFAGSEIRLSDGRYVWTKFTDQVVVDADGNEIDPFPGFPREADYTREGDRIVLSDAPDGQSVTMHLVEEDGSVYLYTAAEATAFDATGERPACPLKLQAAN